MMDFTQDERNMMMLYSPGTRNGLIAELPTTARAQGQGCVKH